MISFLRQLRAELTAIAIYSIIALSLLVIACILAWATSTWFVLISMITLYWLFNREKTLSPYEEKSRNDVFVVIVGGVFSGICAGIKLKRDKIRFVILEKSAELGGTWYDNTYPGCACDTVSHVYSFSFHLNPYWSRVYSSQKEILNYFQHIVDYYGLKEFTRFNCHVEKATFDKHTNKWTVALKDGEEIKANFLISAIGALHVPKYPDLNGRNDFQGDLFHTAQWKKDFDVNGKSVAVIGTGASAVQVVPSIAPLVKHLYVFQRHPAWVPIKLDLFYPSIVKKLFEVFPIFTYLHRWYMFIGQEAKFFFIFQKGSPSSKEIRKNVTKIMKDQIDDPKLKEKMIPDYEMGCKRITSSNEYLSTFNRSNVTLVTEPIGKLIKNGIQVTTGEELKLDAVICATGYDLNKSLNGMNFINGDCSLSERWGNTPNAYLGIMSPEFPNLFMLLGPGTGLGHNSVIWMVECQVTYVVDAITKCIDKQLKSLEVKESVNNTYQSYIRNESMNRPFSSSCGSWYTNEKGDNFVLWPSHLLHYWWLTLWVNLNEFKTT